VPDDRAPLARRLGVRRVYILNDDAPCSAGIAADFRRAAQRLGLRVAGSANWAAPRGLAERVRASGADGVFLAGYVLPFGARDHDAAPRPARRHQADRTGRLLYPRRSQVRRARRRGPDRKPPRAAAGTTPRSRGRLRRQFQRGHRPATAAYVVNAAQATDVLLDAIERSDGTRASVVRELFATRVNNGILGSFAITPQGDTTARAVTIYRIKRGAFHVWQVITPPTNLTGG